jgi:nicotinamidase-related amidase
VSDHSQAGGLGGVQCTRPVIIGRPALLVIDMQREFLEARSPFYVRDGVDLVLRINELTAAARRVSAPVIFTQETHRRRRVDSGRELDPGAGAGLPGLGENDPEPEHCVEGTSGVDLWPALDVESTDIFVRKPRYNAFLDTDLDHLLRALEVSTLLATGVNTNICVLWTVGDAVQRDFHVRVIEDCVAGSPAEHHEAALLLLRALTIKRPVLARDVVLALAAGASRA